MLAPDEQRQLLEGIDVSKPAGPRDRTLVGLMVLSFSQVGAALAMRVEEAAISQPASRLSERRL